MRRRMEGQVVVVTGASSGVGRAIVRELATRKTRLALLARNQEALRDAAEEVRLRGSEALLLPLDVEDDQAVFGAADEVVKQWGRIDTWINDAMVSVFSPAQQMTPEEYRRVTEVTYLGYVWGTLAALRHMVPRDDGFILQIGSALAYRSIPLQSAYCAAKAAIRGFSDSVRTELYHQKSRVKIGMLQLPAVNTPQFDVVRSRLPLHAQPVPPIYQPEVIARAAAYFAEHPRREMWIGWSAAKAILGQRVLPSLLGHYLGRIGFSAQQTRRIPKHSRGDNLDAPLPGDPGAHGEFDLQARRSSSELWLRMNRGWVGLAAGIAGLALLGVRQWRAA